jgi:acyl dehydratase
MHAEGTAASLAEPHGARACEDRFALEIPANAAHVYTECARIWNPIHTDRKAAIDAGLPDIILHGTATLAFAVSQLLGEYIADAPQRVRRLGCRFSGMVMLPSTLALHVNVLGQDGLRFTVQDARGQPVLSAGFVQFDAGA